MPKYCFKMLTNLCLRMGQVCNWGFLLAVPCFSFLFFNCHFPADRNNSDSVLVACLVDMKCVYFCGMWCLHTDQYICVNDSMSWIKIYYSSIQNTYFTALEIHYSTYQVHCMWKFKVINHRPTHVTQVNQMALQLNCIPRAIIDNWNVTETKMTWNSIFSFYLDLVYMTKKEINTWFTCAECRNVNHFLTNINYYYY